MRNPCPNHDQVRLALETQLWNQIELRTTTYTECTCQVWPSLIFYSDRSKSLQNIFTTYWAWRICDLGIYTAISSLVFLGFPVWHPHSPSLGIQNVATTNKAFPLIKDTLTISCCFQDRGSCTWSASCFLNSFLVLTISPFTLISYTHILDNFVRWFSETGRTAREIHCADLDSFFRMIAKSVLYLDN